MDNLCNDNSSDNKDRSVSNAESTCDQDNSSIFDNIDEGTERIENKEEGIISDKNDSSTNCCKWGDEIQACIKKIEEQVKNHEARELSQEAKHESEKLNLKFKQGKKKRKSMWENVQRFLTKPSFFRMKELQVYLEDDIKANDPSISKHDLNEKVSKLINGVENEIREELSGKFPEINEKEIDERVKNIKVKGYLTGDKDKYLSDRAEFVVEDAINSKIMFNKPGLLRRGLNCEKKTYAHLKDMLGMEK